MMRVAMGMVFVGLLAWAGAQPVASAQPPEIEMLWQVLGSVSAIEIDVTNTNIRTAYMAVMFAGDALLRDQKRIGISDETLSVNAGALNPGLVAWCEHVYVVLWSELENEFRRDVSSMEACGGGPHVRRVLDYPSAPFGIPDRVHGRGVELPLDQWILLGVTHLDEGDSGSIIEIDDVITYYVYVTEDPAAPKGVTSRPPDYVSLQEAESVLKVTNPAK